ncbi:MAG: hotdog fold thioesterase [Actinomycetia bacterium]|nr:hotdog fold thioesterase [Actinomycetes bacterium]
MLELLEIEIVEAKPERVVARMPVTPRVHQPFGQLHGGASVVLAESVASLGTLLHLDPATHVPMGLEINANHLRPKRDGVVTAEAVPLHDGRTTVVWDVRIRDEAGRLVCVSRCTVAKVARPPGVSLPPLADLLPAAQGEHPA